MLPPGLTSGRAVCVSSPYSLAGLLSVAPGIDLWQGCVCSASMAPSGADCRAWLLCCKVVVVPSLAVVLSGAERGCGAERGSQWCQASVCCQALLRR